MINLADNTVSAPARLNHLVDSLSSIYSFPTQLYVDSDNIFLGLERAVVCISTDLNVKYLFKAQENLDHFAVFPQNKLAIFANTSIYLLKRDNGGVLKKLTSDLSGLSFVKSNSGLYGSFNSFLKLNYVNDSVVVENEFTPGKINGLRMLQDGYPAYVIKNNILWFAFGKREKMWVLNDRLNRIAKVISFGKFDLSTDNQDQVNYNETYLDFSIEVKDDVYYIIHFRNHTLSVFSGCLGLNGN
jgi:hypothetical protein